MTRKTNENYLAYAERATQSLCDGSIGYDEWCEAVLGETIYSEENLRRCYQFFKYDDVTDYDKEIGDHEYVVCPFYRRSFFQKYI